MNYRIFETTEDLINSAAATIVQRAQAKDVAVSIALSGGSSPKPLYEKLATSPMREALAAKQIHWIIVDERYVPWDDERSNYRMIHQALFSNGMSPNHRFLPFRTDLPDAHQSAAQFSEEWQKLGIGNLDLIVLGVGEDGHTASLFPDTEGLQEKEKTAIANFVPKLDMWRVTITMPVIQKAGLRMVLAAGAGKRKILGEIEAGADYPIVDATSEGESWWFVDRAAKPE